MKLHFCLLLCIVASGYSTPECFDHQSKDYNSQFQPASCNQKCTVTPFFSPDHSLDTYLDLIQSATESIDIYTPGEPAIVQLVLASASRSEKKNKPFPKVLSQILQNLFLYFFVDFYSKGWERPPPLQN